MTSIEAGAFIGITGGAIAGVALCKSHGVAAGTAGAVVGGTVGLFAGVALAFLSAIASALAKIYWEVLTGRRKLPPISETSETRRRHLLAFIAIICALAELIMAALYFAGTPDQRSRVPIASAVIFTATLISLLLLKARYRRYPIQK